MNPVTCSLLWVRCPFDQFSISDFGGKLPLMWKFSKMSFRIPRRDTEVRFVTRFGGNRPLRRCRKVVWFTTEKNSRSAELVPAPIFSPKWADRAQNCLNVVTPWHVQVYRIWFGSAAFCRTYSGKIDFSAQKLITRWAFSLQEAEPEPRESMCIHKTRQSKKYPFAVSQPTVLGSGAQLLFMVLSRQRAYTPACGSEHSVT